jgi:glutamate-ammonia-ligase adenylyltransferase
MDILSDLGAVTPQGRLYETDTRLRPEGKNAPLVSDIEGYARYLTSRASLWERQSLTRLRWIAGDQEVGRAVSAMVNDHVYGLPLPAGWVDTIVDMRRKMETRSRTRQGDFIDVKLGPGGMADVEFLGQMIQLR